MTTVAEFVLKAKTATEEELRDIAMPWPKTADEMREMIDALVNRPQDYGTCVYAMSLSALAAFYYASHVLGVTGFQASCADMDFLARSRFMKDGFRIIDYGNLLYPQYCDEEHFPSWESLLAQDSIRERLREKARERLAEEIHASPSVRAHWERLAQ